ncbi:MAG: isobutyryl-CoA mutase, partial [Actinomycetota bacterium]|nr:isobutyryl-CoA mutase [Actinomycetota bacterium]
VPEEIAELERYGVEKIYSPHDGQRLGLQGMIDDMIGRCAEAARAAAAVRQSPIGEWVGDLSACGLPRFEPRAELLVKSHEASADPTAVTFRRLAKLISAYETGRVKSAEQEILSVLAEAADVPVLGVTGTGGAGKSSLTDELVRRFRLDYGDALTIAVLAIDPSRRKSGGALLGDRIRMNAIGDWGGGARVYMRSMATRDASSEITSSLEDVLTLCKAAGFDLIIVETSGIGQGDAAIVPFVDEPLYVMTPEFGAASQLEKIDMLDFADVVAINKFERRGGEDARRDVGRQLVRNREEFGATWEDMPVFGTSAATFNDEGVTALYQHLRGVLAENGLTVGEGRLPRTERKTSAPHAAVIPPAKARYLADVVETVRGYRAATDEAVDAARVRQHLRTARGLVGEAVDEALAAAEKALPAADAELLESWPQTVKDYSGDELVVHIRDKELRTALTRETLSGSRVSRVALPRYTEDAELLRFLRSENLPGRFPFTAGVFPFKREGEDPARMFAGEGDAFRTNRRFQVLSADSDAKRLSTAFDSVTLYGRDPDTRPDVYGKVGTSGVSIATIEDLKVLYGGFDLCSPTTSVSMTINGPAPTILAFYLNTAIDQRVELFREEEGREPDEAEREELAAYALANVRGTVQADILKEDQGQNTCIFSTEFSLRMMADIQEWFIAHKVRNFYSVSISGYHIAEAGANPISQLAFTLANGFTYVESYLARGMDIDDFAPNLSFFFSNGMDAEYSVIGRVARRIWAIAMRERYGASERSQKLKYHVQTSGRSLHAQEMNFNDIRTTLQALCALYDNANSLHTNAYDEAVTTPTEESVRRAMAIQLIINREWGLSMNENPLQGSFVIEELTDLVEEAVLAEFDRIAERGGVLGAMETGYQRGRIQDESMLYEQRKHDGSLPIIGVNTFVRPESDASPKEIELAR